MRRKTTESDLCIATDKKFWDHMIRPAFRCVLCDEYMDSVKETEKHILKHHSGDELLKFIYKHYKKCKKYKSRERLFSESIEEHEKEKKDDESCE